MCRFLLAKSAKPVPPLTYLEAFASMAEKSRAFDGDWQGDGWGVSWLDTHNNWHVYKSLKPIWEDRSSFNTVPATSIISIHARSASFPEHKDNLAFNQPYINDDYSFVFNGLLKGVTLPSIPGTIGAEKIWFLLQSFLKKYDPETALEKVKTVLIKNTREIQAVNIGLASKTAIYSLNYFTKHPEYYTLHSFTDNHVEITCSEQLDML